MTSLISVSVSMTSDMFEKDVDKNWSQSDQVKPSDQAGDGLVMTRLATKNTRPPEIKDNLDLAVKSIQLSLG